MEHKPVDSEIKGLFQSCFWRGFHAGLSNSENYPEGKEQMEVLCEQSVNIAYSEIPKEMAASPDLLKALELMILASEGVKMSRTVETMTALVTASKQAQNVIIAIKTAQ